jgi:DNA polymerase-3 subunit delta
VSLRPEQLPAALKRGLASVYLVSGDEPLLAGEAADSIRAAARAGGHVDRSVFFIDKSFAWEDFHQATHSLSLFADRRLFELRIASAKPDKEQLLEIVQKPPPDAICLIICGKLDKKAADAPWVRAIEKNGAWVVVRPVDTDALPAWLQARARALRLEIEPAAAQLIVDRVEGNLLAAQQELEKLRLLSGGERITLDLVQRSVGDSARFNVYQMAQAAAAGDASRALHVLSGLKSEGVEPTLILWALVRELRGLWQAQEGDRLHSNSRSGWHLAATPSPHARSRLGKMPLRRLLVQASVTDKIIKGLAPGDAWTALTGLAAAFSGALQAPGVSGRVVP